MHYKIVNIVATAKVERELDLEKLAGEVSEIKYDPTHFPGAKYKPSNQVTILIFRTGNLVCVGCKSEEQINESFSLLEKDLKSVYPEIEIYSIRIENKVGICDFGRKIDLLEAYEKIGRRYKALYEPDQFPGLMIWFSKDNKKLSFLLFTSGKCIIGGIRNDKKALEALGELEEILFEN